MLKLILFLIACANVHALWEIQIESGQGWAKSLPCWRYNIFITKLLFGKEITGYHFWMMAMYQMAFHIPYLFINWSWKAEAITQGLFIYYFILEDILWFCWNPKYTIKKFHKHQIEWHKRWVFGLPLSYWMSAIIGGFLLLIGGR
jgi:hypothetical protein